jgi:hypothetical protein
VPDAWRFGGRGQDSLSRGHRFGLAGSTSRHPQTPLKCDKSKSNRSKSA